MYCSYVSHYSITLSVHLTRQICVKFDPGGFGFWGEFFAEGGRFSVRHLGNGSRIREKINKEERKIVCQKFKNTRQN